MPLIIQMLFDNPTDFQNTTPNQIVYARVLNPFGCFDIAELELQTSNNILNIPTIEACDLGDLMVLPLLT